MTGALFISVVDDDESIRESIPDLLRAFGFQARAFDSAETFLASNVIDTTDCIILDVAMPGMSGPELLAKVLNYRRHIPVVFITAAHEDGHLCQDLIDLGAAACLHKPFEPSELVAALRGALPRD